MVGDFLMEIKDIVPFLTLLLMAVFGAGQVVEKVRNNKYTSKYVCDEKHKNIDEALKRIEENVKLIPEIKAWIDLHRQ